MTNRLWMRSALACSVLLSAGLLAQDNPATTQPANMDLTGLPYGRGVFYKSGADWVVLSHNVLMPFSEGRALALDILNVGSNHATSEMLGAHSGIQIADPRPTFYLHGINPSDVYLVRAIPKDDYREVRMPLSRHYRKWAHFRAVDVSELAITGINGDVIAVRPSADLKPGEYALTAGAQHGDEWLRLGFDFGILAPR